MGGEGSISGNDSLLLATDEPKPTQQGLPGIPQRPSPILHLLPSKAADGDPVEPDEKTAWWEWERDTVFADSEAAAIARGVSDARGRGAFLRATALRYFKHYLTGPRRFKGAAEAERLKDAAERYFFEASDPRGPSDDDPGERPASRLRQMEI